MGACTWQSFTHPLIISHCISFATLIAGWSPTTNEPDANVTALLAERGAADSPPGVEAIEHDFGAVLVRGQTLRHEFALANNSDRPLHLLQAETSTPCCSAIGPLSDVIPAHGVVKVAAIFKPGFQAGRRRVEFTIRTDRPDRPFLSLALLATLTSEFEVRHLDGSDASVPMGRTGRQLFAVVCRRIGDQGRGVPENLVASEPIIASFVGPIEETRHPHGLIEATRTVQAICPPRRRRARNAGRSCSAGRTARNECSLWPGRSRRTSGRRPPVSS